MPRQEWGRWRQNGRGRRRLGMYQDPIPFPLSIPLPYSSPCALFGTTASVVGVSYRIGIIGVFCKTAASHSPSLQLG